MLRFHSLLLSTLLTLIADGFGRRKILFAGSCLMVISGAAFAYFENFFILLAAAVIGVISATGSDFGPFRAIEESTLSHLTNSKTRAEVLSWYVTTASVGSAIGTEISGRVVEHLRHREGWTIVDAYHSIFWIYSCMGIFNAFLTLLMSSKCEVEKKEPERKSSDGEAGVLLNEMDDRSPITDRSMDESEGATTTFPASDVPKKSRFAQISKETRSKMYKLWFLLMIDTLADGMVGYSLTVYYMDQKFGLPKSTLGDITSASYFLSSASTIFAGPLSKRIGLINIMVFTHLPSSAAVLLFPLPSSIFFTVALFFLRTGLNNMDQAPRSAFIAAVVKPEERTAVMGITSMLRTLAATAGPSVTGILGGINRFWIAFVAAGALRICYDLGLWAMFINMKLHQHEKDAALENGSENESDDDEDDESGGLTSSDDLER